MARLFIRCGSMVDIIWLDPRLGYPKDISDLGLIIALSVQRDYMPAALVGKLPAVGDVAHLQSFHNARNSCGAVWLPSNIRP